MIILAGGVLTVLFVLWLIPPHEYPHRLKLSAYAYTIFTVVELLAGLLF